MHKYTFIQITNRSFQSIYTCIQSSSGRMGALDHGRESSTITVMDSSSSSDYVIALAVILIIRHGQVILSSLLTKHVHVRSPTSPARRTTFAAGFTAKGRIPTRFAAKGFDFLVCGLGNVRGQVGERGGSTWTPRAEPAPFAAVYPRPGQPPAARAACRLSSPASSPFASTRRGGGRWG